MHDGVACMARHCIPDRAECMHMTDHMRLQTFVLPRAHALACCYIRTKRDADACVLLHKFVQNLVMEQLEEVRSPV